MKKSFSSWGERSIGAHFPPLSGNLTTEIVIIGGGMAGLLTAYELCKTGKKVVILEAGRLASGATQYTTAFLTQVIDTDALDLIKMFGLRAAHSIWDSHLQGIDFIAKIVRSEKIECEFKRCSNFVYARSEDELKNLQKEFAAIKKLGASAIMRKRDGLGLGAAGYIEIKNQAKFHPLKFLNGLVEVLKKSGTRICERTRAEKVEGKGPITVIAGKHKVKADYVITATYDPLGNPIQTFMKKGMYRSYVFEVRVPKGKLTEGTYEDMENPYHYFRIDRQGKTDRMIFGGEDHRQELKIPERKNFAALERHLKIIMGQSRYRIVRKWTGPILEPSDGLALIGEYKPRRLVATAFSGNGMTYSAISAMVSRDIISGTRNRLIRLYHPTRIPTVGQLVRKVRDFAGEMVGGAVRNTLGK